MGLTSPQPSPQGEGAMFPPLGGEGKGGVSLSFEAGAADGYGRQQGSTAIAFHGPPGLLKM